MRRSFLALFMILTSLFGCATRIPKEALRPPSVSESIALAPGLTYLVQSGQSSGQTFSLKEGKYVPVFEDDNGVYYKGPEACVVASKQGTLLYADEGGFWLPKSGSTLPSRIFVYEGTRGYYKKRNNNGGETQGNTGNSSTDAAIRDAAVRSTPSTASPIRAGVVAGVASGIIAAIATVDRERIFFIADHIPAEANLRSYLAFEHSKTDATQVQETGQ